MMSGIGEHGAGATAATGGAGGDDATRGGAFVPALRKAADNPANTGIVWLGAWRSLAALRAAACDPAHGVSCCEVAAAAMTSLASSCTLASSLLQTLIRWRSR